jgi:hypothetical protein
MLGDPSFSERKATSSRYSRQPRNLQSAQQVIYSFLLDIVKKWPPEEVLLEFKRLFLCRVDSATSDAMESVYDLVFSNNEEEFRNTLKRSCYILVNNWDAARRVQPIRQLLNAFWDETLPKDSISPTLNRLRAWVERFKNSSDFQDLKLFTSRYDNQQNPEDLHWVKRYTSYLLVPQYIDQSNPIEQREAARALAKQLRDQFKFDLAMYVARSQSIQTTPNQPPKNPTVLGEEVLRLIKTVVVKRGSYNYTNLANIFLQQNEGVSYSQFKQNFITYLLSFANDSAEHARTLRKLVVDRLDTLYKEYENDTVTDALILRTSNRVIDFLTTENRQQPSSMFVLLLSQGNPMTLVIALLKLILASRNSRLYLEARIADLIHYYENYPEDECRWVVNFLEIFNVIFTIHAENVQYNLIRMEEIDQNELQDDLGNLDAYRIFSQAKRYVIEEEVIEEQPETPASEDDDMPTLIQHADY